MSHHFKTIIISLLVMLLGCSNPAGNPANELNSSTDCKPYFDYDKVEHYCYNIPEDEIWEMEQKEKKTDKENRQLELLIQDTPDKLSDTTVFRGLNQIGYAKHDIPRRKFEELDMIFCEREHHNTVAMSCIAIYRDILLFKKSNRITGVAKICFGCNQSIITGTSRNTEMFGQSGDYEKLYNLLN